MLKYQVAYRNLRLAVQNLKLVRGISSVGRALRSHRRGQGFESPILHRRKPFLLKGFVVYQPNFVYEFILNKQPKNGYRSRYLELVSINRVVCRFNKLMLSDRQLLKTSRLWEL
jgi:hypothetical protein